MRVSPGEPVMMIDANGKRVLSWRDYEALLEKENGQHLVIDLCRCVVRKRLSLEVSFVVVELKEGEAEVVAKLVEHPKVPMPPSKLGYTTRTIEAARDAVEFRRDRKSLRPVVRLVKGIVRRDHLWEFRPDPDLRWCLFRFLREDESRPLMPTLSDPPPPDERALDETVGAEAEVRGPLPQLASSRTPGPSLDVRCLWARYYRADRFVIADVEIERQAESSAVLKHIALSLGSQRFSPQLGPNIRPPGNTAPASQFWYLGQPLRLEPVDARVIHLAFRVVDDDAVLIPVDGADATLDASFVGAERSIRIRIERQRLRG